MESSVSTFMTLMKDGIYAHITMDLNTITAAKHQQSIANAIGHYHQIQWTSKQLETNQNNSNNDFDFFYTYIFYFPNPMKLILALIFLSFIYIGLGQAED